MSHDNLFFVPSSVFFFVYSQKIDPIHGNCSLVTFPPTHRVALRPSNVNAPSTKMPLLNITTSPIIPERPKSKKHYVKSSSMFPVPLPMSLSFGMITSVRHSPDCCTFGPCVIRPVVMFRELIIWPLPSWRCF